MNIDVWNKMNMDIAMSMAKYSKANRAKVGAVLVTSNGVVLPSYNGTPVGTDNSCEENDVTKPTTIHAELNCVLKAAREGVSILGCTIYTTLSPCMSCAAMLLQSGVRCVVYLDEYRDVSPLEYLRANGMTVVRLTTTQKI
jgi:dCMP deaminase